jgi:uncharacterized metal-binding protein
MDQIEHLWFEFWDIFRHGIAHISNPIVGIVIALLAGLMVRGIFNLFIISFLAVLVHLLAEALIPVVMNHAALVLPKIDHAFFQYALTLYVGYFVVILVIYFVKLIFASVRA